MKASFNFANLFATIVIIATPWQLAQADPVYTIPVGYESRWIHGDSYNLLALRLHPNIFAASNFETISGTTLIDNHLDFDSTLSSQTPYLVELIGGAVDGMVLDVVAFSGHTLTVAETLPTETNITYQIRAVPRLSEIISPSQILAVDDFNPDHGDLILIPSGGGKFNQYFGSSRIGHMGYFNAATGVPEDPLVRYTESFFYLRRGALPLNFVVSGEVKLKNTLLAVTDVFNYVGSAYPTVLLGETSLEMSIQTGTAETGDIVWLQNESGDYLRYFFSDGTPPLNVGWRLVDAPFGTENHDQWNTPITSGLIIQRRAPVPYNALLTPPDVYATL